MKNKLLVALLIFGAASLHAVEPSFSTAGVTNYAPCPNFQSLPWATWNAYDFQCWYGGGSDCFGGPPTFGGAWGWGPIRTYPTVSNWVDGDVWGSDFRNGNGFDDTDPTGGSDLPGIYFYAGHGICQEPPIATDPDFISPCGNFGDPDDTDIGVSSVWGSRSSGGHLQFLFLDTSCPMDLISLERNWYWAFDGLHVALGHSGRMSGDTLDSPFRAADFAAYSAGSHSLLPHLSAGDAWMMTGLIDVQPGVCAVAIAQGPTVDDAIDRRHNERTTDGRVDPDPQWVAWRFVCN